MTCIRCGSGQVFQSSAYIPLCRSCKNDRTEESRVATRKVVKNLIFTGLIPKAKDADCVDCGNQAHDYDHRDYVEPLNVVPVCRRCNVFRGPAYDSVMRPGGALDFYMTHRKAKSNAKFTEKAA